MSSMFWWYKSMYVLVFLKYMDHQWGLCQQWERDLPWFKWRFPKQDNNWEETLIPNHSIKLLKSWQQGPVLASSLKDALLAAYSNFICGMMMIFQDCRAILCRRKKPKLANSFRQTISDWIKSTSKSRKKWWFLVIIYRNTISNNIP